MERLGDDARRILGSAGPAARDDLVAIAEAWPGAVGAAIAAAAWPNRIARDGSLQVATVSAVWAFELGGMQAQILEQLRSAVPALAVPALRFAVGPVPAAAAAETVVEDAPQPTPTERREAAEIASAIDDADLRQSVARAAAASLARARSDRHFW
jgi:predicted nucleic acid-binding Zn ribbon protein